MYAQNNISQPIKILRDQNYYIIKLPYLGHNITVTHNGKRISYDEVYTCESLEEIKFHKSIIKRIRADGTTPDIPSISIDEYDSRLKYLESKGEYADGELIFEELNDEYEYKKFLKNYKVYTESDSIEIEIPFEIENIITPDSPFMIPVRHLGKCIMIQKVKYTRVQAVVHFITTTLHSNGYTEDKSLARIPMTYKLFINNRPGNISLYIDGNQILNLTNVYDMTDDYEKMLNQMQKDEKMITDKITSYINGKSLTVNGSEVIMCLDKISTLVKQIPGKTIKTVEAKQECLNYIKTLVSEFKARVEITTT